MNTLIAATDNADNTSAVIFIVIGEGTHKFPTVAATPFTAAPLAIAANNIARELFGFTASLRPLNTGDRITITNN